MGREWKVRRGKQRDEMRGLRREAILITVLCESLCGFNSVSFTAGAISAVLRKETLPSLHTHTCTYSTNTQSAFSAGQLQVNAPLAFSQFSSLHRSTWATGAIGHQWDQQSFLRQPSSLSLSSHGSQACGAEPWCVSDCETKPDLQEIVV